MKKIFIVLMILAAVITSLSFFVGFDEDRLNVLILHNKDSDKYLDTYQHFKQSLIVNLRVNDAVTEDLKDITLRNYQVLYIESEVAGDSSFEQVKEIIAKYVENGGNLFLNNEFYDRFPKAFLGAESFTEVGQLPEKLDYPEARHNLSGMQEVLKEFYVNYKGFNDIEEVKKKSLGYGMKPSTAETLSSYKGISLYTVNRVGKGSVFFAGKLLPNDYYVTGFDFKPKNEEQKFFNFTAATASYLLKNEYAAYISKEKYGYVVKKVLGTYGRPAIAWQNHFEVLSAVRDGSMQKWIDFLKAYRQIPSYTLARASYDWGVWKESVTYHLNIGTNQSPAFLGEEENSHYSSGRHAMLENGYLEIRQYPEFKSLAWPVELPYKAYPFVYDLDGDNVLDIISGSSDGHIYFYKGKGFKDSWNFEKGLMLKFEDGTPVYVGSFSAPILYDIDRDGKMDIVTGNREGSVQVLFNKGRLAFANAETLVPKSEGIAVSAPDIGDVDGDGKDDLVLGDEKGHLYIFKGEIKNNRLSFEQSIQLMDGRDPIAAGRYAAPRLYDIDGDGRKDILVGNDKGYLKKYLNRYPLFADGGYIEGKTLNQFGENYLWGGHNTVPCLADINNDGKTDLIVGQLEFGMQIPIDSPEYPYKEELKKALDYARANFIDIHPHVYVHSYKSKEQEERELELHKKAFETYNIPWNNPGTNQHTWRINNLNPAQTLYSELKSGIWWNSGFKPANNPVEPSLGREYAWSIPFLLSNGKNNEQMLLFNPSPNVPLYEDAYYAISRFDLPVSYFWHIEYAVQKEDGIKDLSYKAAFLDQFRNNNDYNFMMEEQMVKSFFAVMKTNISISYNPVERVIHTLQNSIRTKKQFSLHLQPSIPQGLELAGEYRDTAGVKLEIGEKLLGQTIKTDSDIYIRKGSDLYLGVMKDVKVYFARTEDKPHIVRSNSPLNIRRLGSRVEIDIKGNGLQQIKLYAPKGAEIEGREWDIIREGECYTLTRYGDATRLVVRYK